MINKENLEVKFLTNHHFLLDIEECIPKPASHFLPKWWKDAPNKIGKERTVKLCPSYADLYSSGYIIPMWTDTIFRRLPNGQFEWEVSDGIFQWDFHANNQFVDYIKTKNNLSMVVIKAISPWFAITPKNVSIWQKPLFYDFSDEYTVLEGIIHTDFHHELNQQVLYKSKKNEILIERGTPFAWYVPFERKKFNYSVKEVNEQEKRQLITSKKRISTKFTGGYIQHLKKLKGIKYE
jgi:hypothetical protein